MLSSCPLHSRKKPSSLTPLLTRKASEGSIFQKASQSLKGEAINAKYSERGQATAQLKQQARISKERSVTKRLGVPREETTRKSCSFGRKDQEQQTEANPPYPAPATPNNDGGKAGLTNKKMARISQLMLTGSLGPNHQPRALDREVEGTNSSPAGQPEL